LLLSKKIKENGNADVELSSINHEGCHRNTTHLPATAEEAMSEDMGKFVLMSSDGTYLSDNEAIFADEIVSDGDTKGRN
jgi:hypothetical protein